jgi:hypothetical protein
MFASEEIDVLTPAEIVACRAVPEPVCAWSCALRLQALFTRHQR